MVSEATSVRADNAAPVQAVQRTMRVLECLVEAGSGMSVLELASAVAVDKSVVSRLLASLASQGYVIRDSASDRYVLSLKLLSLASRYADRMGFPWVAQPVLQQLSDDTRELTQLAAVERSRLRLAAHSKSSQQLAIMPPTLGSSVALHATASGKAYLASLPDERALELALGFGLSSLTSRTITTAQRLLEELAAIRAQGYSFCQGEFHDGINAVACAIGKERFGFCVGTVALSAPESRLAGDRVEEKVQLLRDAAAAIEAVWPLEIAGLAQLDPTKR